MNCKNCGKDFNYRLVGTVYPGVKEKEDIHCPYCNHICESVMTSQFVETIKDDNESEISKRPKDLLTEQETQI